MANGGQLWQRRTNGRNEKRARTNILICAISVACWGELAESKRYTHSYIGCGRTDRIAHECCCWYCAWERTHALCVSGDFFSTFSLDNNARALICSWHFVCSVLAHANYENINASAYCDDFISVPLPGYPISTFRTNLRYPYTHINAQSNTRATCKRLRDDDYYIVTRIALESAHTHTHHCSIIYCMWEYSVYLRISRRTRTSRVCHAINIWCPNVMRIGSCGRTHALRTISLHKWDTLHHDFWENRFLFLVIA